METEVLGLAISTAKAFEDLGIVGVMFVWIVYREYQHYKFSTSSNDKLIASYNSILKLTDEINNKTIEQSKNDDKLLLIITDINQELKKRNEIDASLMQYTKDTCVGVKIRLDKIDNKIDEIDKKIIALK